MLKVVCFLLFVVSSGCFYQEEKGKVLLLSIDGLRWDQFGLDIPSLQQLEHHGVKADWLDGVFLTYTMPSMYSLATGLYPESHGVIHNKYFNANTHTLIPGYDDVLNITEFFDTGVEPIWVSAKLAGKKVACFMWAGTAVPVKGVQCDHVTYLNSWNRENYLPKDQVKDAVLWLVEKDFDLVLLALELPDEALHQGGVDSDQFHLDLWDVDNTLNCFLDDIDQRGLWETLNLIVVSDHGHAVVHPENFISLTDYIDEDDIEFSVFVNSLFQLKARAGAETKKFDPSKDCLNASDHGYDNEHMDMKAIFYARGPAFKSSYRAKPLESVDIYGMICDILDINEVPNNGSRHRYINMMVEKTTSRISRIIFYLLSTTAFFSLLFAYFIQRGWFDRRKSKMNCEKGA